ncbi:MAG TPA: hypothetical protein PLD25_25785 [Chloroflexota bacterium]|nr:hypothetical protein [Chloroflexota bacterium]HUM72159.1 hypothetical protein [Chloroflexota bacterium]
MLLCCIPQHGRAPYGRIFFCYNAASNEHVQKRRLMKITITKDNLLTPAEFKFLLEQTEARSSATDYVFRLLRELVVFEEKYGMKSDVFYARFMRGEMGDDLPFIKWAGRYELYLEARQEIDTQLAQLPITV